MKMMVVNQVASVNQLKKSNLVYGYRKNHLQKNIDTLGAHGLQGLTAGVVEFAGFADLEGSGTQYQDFVKIDGFQGKCLQ